MTERLTCRSAPRPERRRSWLARLLAALWLAACAASMPALAQARPAATPVAPAVAQPSCPPAPRPYTDQEIEAGQREARDRGFLFRVSKDDRVSYLYGTTHVARRDWVFLGPKVLEALGAVDRVALELDLRDAEVLQRLQSAIRWHSRVPPLPDEIARRLGAARAAACADDLAGLRPEFQVLGLTSLALRQDGFDPVYAIDAAVAGYAASLGKPTAGLESPEQQVALIVRDDAPGLAEAVTRMLDELARPQARTQILRLMRAWDAGDLTDISRYEAWCDCLNTPFERAQWVQLLDERNPGMAEQMVRWHAAGERVFVAVGALHLVGAKALPALLEAEGFRVERVLYPRR